MNGPALARYALVAAAAISLAGCGGGQLPSGSTAVVPSQHHVWMDGDLKGQDLLYVSNANGTVNVYKYWTHTLVGILTSFQLPAGQCVDRKGDVYIVDYKAKTISEFAHGGTKALKVITESYEPIACAVDRTTGNLAVANYGATRGYTHAGSLAIYAHGEGKPTYYGRGGHFSACAYDDRGDLLASSYDGYSGYYYGDFYYLPKNGTSILSIELPGPTSSRSDWGYVNGLAYDGQYWVVDSYYLFRYTIDIKPEFIDEIELTGGSGAGGLALYSKSPKADATQVVSSNGYTHEATKVGYWKYPTGGAAYYEITNDLDGPAGVAISPKQ